MSETTATTGSWDAKSTAMDMARLGQMLCSRGIYGNLRWFAPETAEKMLPVKLTMCLGPDTREVHGIGCNWMSTDVFGARTFGHGAASSATLRIDPENALVVSMTRRTAGKNFDTYHSKWLETIADCMIDPKLSPEAQAAQTKRHAARSETAGE
jgi:CubicO group peptidase (beta-lactamase class C family)